jgi:hypothetical protein
MARKAKSSKSKKSAIQRKTGVRHTAMPKIQARPQQTPQRAAAPKAQPQTQRKQVTQEQIAKRAYEIHISGKGGSELDNWLRAERELRA